MRTQETKRIAAFTTLTLVALVGCATAPTAEVHDANDAVESARLAAAPDYAPDEWAAARDAQDRLQAELAAQADRNAFFRSYQAARDLARETKDTAEAAAEAAVSGKARAREEALSLMTSARDAHAAALEAIAESPKGKGTEADLASLRSDAQTIEATLLEMQSALDAGDYIRAKVKAEAAIASSNRIVAEIDEAKTRRAETRRAT
jgi:hypothetical protein